MKVKYTWLIASDDASCFEAVKRDGKADPSREIATVIATMTAMESMAIGGNSCTSQSASRGK
jgi:hypothetical protein